MQQVSGWSEQGGSVVTVPGTQGSGAQRFQQSFRGATVTVRDSSNNLATIYSDDLASPTAKANPFTASSTTGSWSFFTTTGTYTLTFSGGSILAPFSITVNVGLGNAGGVPSYAFASLPTSKTQNAGDIARVTNNAGGLWMDSGVQWVKQSPFINVKDAPFSARGDGTTDDTTAIQAAIAAAISLGVAVKIPAGTYKLTGNINLTSNTSNVGTNRGIEIIGDGKNTTYLQWIVNPASVTVALDMTGSAHCLIQDIALLNGTSTADAAGTLLLQGAATSSGAAKVESVQNVFDRCAFNSYGTYTIYNAGAEACVFNDCISTTYTGATNFWVILGTGATTEVTSPNQTLFAATSVSALAWRGKGALIISATPTCIRLHYGAAGGGIDTVFIQSDIQISNGAGTAVFIRDDASASTPKLNNLDLDIELEAADAGGSTSTILNTTSFLTLVNVCLRGEIRHPSASSPTLSATLITIAGSITNLNISDFNPAGYFSGSFVGAMVSITGTAKGSLIRYNASLLRWGSYATYTQGMNSILFRNTQGMTLITRDGIIQSSNSAIIGGAIYGGIEADAQTNVVQIHRGAAAAGNSDGGIFMMSQSGISNSVATQVCAIVGIGGIIEIVGINAAGSEGWHDTVKASLSSAGSPKVLDSFNFIGGVPARTYAIDVSGFLTCIMASAGLGPYKTQCKLNLVGAQT